MDEHMARVPKEHFASLAMLPYDVYVRLGADHFVQIGKNGGSSRLQDMKAYLSPEIAHFHIHRGEYPVYVEQTVNHAMLLGMAEGDWAPRAAALAKAIGAMNEWMTFSGFTPAAWNQCQKISDLLRELIPSTPALGPLIQQVESLGESAVRHSVLTGFLAVMMGRAMDVSEEDEKNLAIAALLHDVGMTKLPPDLANKRLDMMTVEEFKVYETHPWEGAQIVRQCAQVPGAVITIIYEHHENELGTGYPRALAKNKINPLALIVGLADHFSELTLGDPNHQDFLSPQAAINTIANVEGHPYGLQLIKVLSQFIRPGQH